MLQLPLKYTQWYRPLEQSILDGFLLKHFGFHLLLLGNTDLAQVKNSAVNHHFAVREVTRLGFEGVVSRFDTLPFEPDSIDLMVLAHALDHCDEPVSVVNEIHKTLRHDGTLLVTGFNCWRSLARALWQYENRQYASDGHLLGVSAVKALLRQAGFEVVRVKRFGVIASRWGDRSLLGKVLLRCAPCLCIGYVLEARKVGMRLQALTFKEESVATVKEAFPGS